MRKAAPLTSLFFPSLREGKNPGGNSPDCHLPSRARAKNQAVNIDTPLRGGELPPGLTLE